MRIEIKHITPIGHMVRAMRAAGYAEYPDNFEAAVETEDSFVFIAGNEDGGLTVGRFFKETGDFGAEPILETDSLEAAVDALEQRSSS